jgi:hypothetical protein
LARSKGPGPPSGPDTRPRPRIAPSVPPILGPSLPKPASLAGEVLDPAGSLLQEALRLSRIIPLPDESGLGLLRFGVEPGISVAGISQLLDLPTVDPISGEPSNALLSNLTELIGVELAVSWEVLPVSGKTSGDPGTVVPFSVSGNEGPTGQPGDPVKGMDVPLLPLPLPTSRPDVSRGRLLVTL